MLVQKNKSKCVQIFGLFFVLIPITSEYENDCLPVTESTTFIQLHSCWESEGVEFRIDWQ